MGKCPCKFVLAVLIIIFVWVSPALWSKVLITICAAAILLICLGKGCKYCREPEQVATKRAPARRKAKKRKRRKR